jgi:hypothetical protein
MPRTDTNPNGIVRDANTYHLNDTRSRLPASQPEDTLVEGNDKAKASLHERIQDGLDRDLREIDHGIQLRARNAILLM